MSAIADVSKPLARGLRHYCDIVAPHRWREIYIMLTACFDGAGKQESSRTIVVAGFASFSGVWSEFEERWLRRLWEDDLPYFHAVDFAHSRGPFRDGWRDNEDRRRNLAADLFEIIQSCGLRRFGNIVRVEDVKEAAERHSQEDQSLMGVFPFAAMRAVDTFHSYALSEGVARNIRCVFEKGDPEDQIRELFKHQGYVDPHFTWAREHTDTKGITHDPFIGLQAADWLAYEYYLDADRLMFTNPTNRWIRAQFDSLPGNMILTYQRTVIPRIKDIDIRRR